MKKKFDRKKYMKKYMKDYRASEEGQKKCKAANENYWKRKFGKEEQIENN